MHWFFHSFLLSKGRWHGFFSSLEGFHLEHDLRGDGSFLIEHGVCEGLLGDGADFSGDAEVELMNGFESLVIEDGLLSACKLEVMVDIGFGLLGCKPWLVVSYSNTLIEGLHHGELHDSSEIGLPGQDQNEGIVGVHLKVGQKPEFLQGAGLKQMTFVHDQDHGFSHLLLGFQKSLLDLCIDGAFGHSLW